jgi:L-alanine-DL-glutamate epimerase-like enolase superfamily enzyme
MIEPVPSIGSVEASAYTVPTDEPEADGTAEWTSTTLVLVRVAAGDEVGTGWTYGPVACARIVGDLLAGVVKGGDALGTNGLWSAMHRALRNTTPIGVGGYALSAVDVALWDLKARLLGVALADAFGRAHGEVPVYGSGGFTTYTNERLTEQLRGWAKGQGIPRVKIKIGQSPQPDVAKDLARIACARRAVGPDVELYVDANGSYTAKGAIRMLRQAASDDVRWFEEPVSSDDLAGLRMVREAVDADVAAGEYGSDVYYFRRMCAAGAVDCLQIDATRCGGYTGWLRAAAVASSYALDVSGHCAPNLHAHVAAATPHLRHLEWFHDHVRIEEMLFDGTLDPAGGSLTPDARKAGHGLTFSDERAEEFRVA